MARKLSPEKRTQYLNAALKLFVAKGVQNTSTAAIAKEAGTAAGTLFLYFPTKQNLVDELILEISKEQSAYIQSLLADSLSAKQMFSAIWHGVITWFRNHLDAYQYVQQVRDTGLISEQVVEESNQYVAYYYLAIQKGLQEGAIKPYPVELTGEMLYRAIVAVMNLIAMVQDLAQQDAYIQFGFEIYWNGIKS
jgi:AcrR family transcriptional regulator